MGLLSFRVVGVLIGVILSLGFATGIFHWNKDNTACIDGKAWKSTKWDTLVAVGKFEIRSRDWNYDCSGMKYDKGTFRQYP